MAPRRVGSLLLVDVQHFDEAQDTDPDPQVSQKSDPYPLQSEKCDPDPQPWFLVGYMTSKV
jgi:hypothetical protein